MLMLWEVLANPNVPRIQMCAIPCLYLFSFASDLHWIRLLIIRTKIEENVVEQKKRFGELKLKGKDCEMADLDALKGKEFVNDLENTPLKKSWGCRDAWLSSENMKDEVQQEEAMHEAEEPKGMETSMENRDVIFNSEDDEDLPELEELTEIVKEDTGSVEENDGPSLLKKVEKKHEMAKEKHIEECKVWKEQENCLYSMLSRETTRAEFYSLKARENEEKLRKLEEEKSELMEKLCTANVKSELYRSLLHDECPTQNCCLD